MFCLFTAPKRIDAKNSIGEELWLPALLAQSYKYQLSLAVEWPGRIWPRNRPECLAVDRSTQPEMQLILTPSLSFLGKMAAGGCLIWKLCHILKVRCVGKIIRRLFCSTFCNFSSSCSLGLHFTSRELIKPCPRHHSTDSSQSIIFSWPKRIWARKITVLWFHFRDRAEMKPKICQLNLVWSWVTDYSFSDNYARNLPSGLLKVFGCGHYLRELFWSRVPYNATVNTQYVPLLIAGSEP